MASGLRVLQVTLGCISFASAAMVPGCHSRPVAVRPDGRVTTDVERFASYMCGHFSSAAQAAADPEFRDISLKVARIWEGREDSKCAWLYVEQALGSDLDHPYRQRLYRVSSPQAGQVQTDVFSLPSPADAVGAWRNPSLLDNVAVRDLLVRQGCSVYLTVRGDHYVGSTRDKECSSELSGATYATSEADIGPAGMVTWDRGFDAGGKQVWGATKGGYRFDKLSAGLVNQGSNKSK